MVPWLKLISFGLWWKRERPIKTLKEKRQMLKALKGKRTYLLLGGILSVVATQILGDGVISEADLTEIGEGCLAIGAIVTRYLATRSSKE